MKITKKYWLKIGKKEDIKYLIKENYQGLSYTVQFRPREYSVNDINKEEFMILYVKGEKSFYLGKIRHIKIETEDKDDKWVHFIYLGPLHNRGYYMDKIKDWKKLSKQLTFLKKYNNNIGSALRCSMIEIGKEDFTRIVVFFNDKITID